MSFYFQFNGETKDEAKAAAAAEFDNVVGAQPHHARDRAQALAAVNAYIDLLAEDDACTITGTVSGSIMWVDGVEALPLLGASVSVGVSLVSKTA